MSERRTETVAIKTKRGPVQYAKVAARLAEFHHDNETCEIETSCEFRDGWAMFAAKVKTKKGVFTGHSLEKVAGSEKQFEKQETIAVGRALAFAGYLSSGEIACAEEMADIVTAAQLDGLKLKYAAANKAGLNGQDQPTKRRAFCTWARSVAGEDVDYMDHTAWRRDWYLACWQDLTGVSPEVPFEG